jgi:GntR family transcriptional regulator/MocR family aminotransferase
MVVAAGSVKAKRPGNPVRLARFAQRLPEVPDRWSGAASKLIVDFRYGDLASTDFPTRIWKRAVDAALTERPQRLGYADPRGSRELRVALQGYLWRARTLRCDVDQVVIVNGSQQGLDLCARLLLDSGDRFAIENPGYAMARHVFCATGAVPVPIPVDGNGLNTDLLESTNARLVYVTPSHQFPLGSVMSIARRHQLVGWARRARAFVIEDDYDSEYRYDIRPVPPVCALEDEGNVIYVGTVSKTLCPTLRLGYLVVPPTLQEAFAATKLLVDRHTPLLEQTALAVLLRSGAYERHVRQVRRRNGERRSSLLDALRRSLGERIVIEGADAGLHIVVWFPELPRSMTDQLIGQARQLGVGLYPVAPLYDPNVIRAQPDHVGLVMGYAALDTRQIARGVQLLRRALDRL